MELGPQATKNAVSEEGTGATAVIGRPKVPTEASDVLVLPRHIKFLIFDSLF
jgi:hypothetical protein